jgi:hypothetical protein
MVIIWMFPLDDSTLLYEIILKRITNSVIVMANNDMQIHSIASTAEASYVLCLRVCVGTASRSALVLYSHQRW